MVASDIDWHQSPSQEMPELAYPVVSFRQHQSRNQLVPRVAYPKRDLERYQTLLRQILVCVFSIYTVAHTLWLELVLRVNKPEG